jgi:16S rRNA (cytidine1402-2'-O)-methyltransferase
MLQDLAQEPRTLVFFESPRRLKATLADMVWVLGGVRRVSVLRELTKRFEETVLATLGEMAERFENDDDPVRGELVIIVEGCQDPVAQRLVSPDDVLPILAEHLQPGTASQAAVKLFGGRRNDYYDQILALTKQDVSDG